MKKNNFILSIIIILLLIILTFLLTITYYTIQIYNSEKVFLSNMLDFIQNNSENVFTINKITYFSSADAEISTNSNSVFKISDLYQYTDIAIFINQNVDSFTEKNTLKAVELSELNFSLLPINGTPNLYYKNLNDFSTPKILEENLITESLQFETTSDNQADYSKPILFNNCANPITLSYVNSKIKNEYTFFNDVSSISHDGSLLKKCGITLNSISCKLNFTIKITNYLDETYICNLDINIPLSTENSTLYDGTLLLNDTSSYNFINVSH